MSPATIYHIRVRGRLDAQWAEWLDGLVMSHDAGRDATSFVGPVRDQAQLHGVLARVRDCGLELLSVTREDEPRERWSPP